MSWFSHNYCIISWRVIAMFSRHPTNGTTNSIPEGDDDLYPYLKSNDCEELDKHCPISIMDISPYTDIWAIVWNKINAGIKKNLTNKISVELYLCHIGPLLDSTWCEEWNFKLRCSTKFLILPDMSGIPLGPLHIFCSTIELPQTFLVRKPRIVLEMVSQGSIPRLENGKCGI